MTKHFLIIILIFINFSSCINLNSDYKSSALDAHNDSISKSWILENSKNKRSLEIPLDYVSIVEIENPVKLNRNFKREYIDSIIKSRKIDVRNPNESQKIWNELHKAKIGPIDRIDAIKYGFYKNYQAAIYIDNLYNTCFEEGYWIALSVDNGKNWKKYYTGLTVNKKFYFKENSKIPLFKNSKILQIEGATVRKVSDRVILLKPEEFAPVKDSIVVCFDVLKITLDSDNDGLTDIVEDRMLLNRYKSDTDGDGIIDSKDKNPRFKTTKTAKSILYEILMESHLYYLDDSYQIDLLNLPTINKFNLSKERQDLISLFVTDDKEVLGLELNCETLIVMSSKEYKNYKYKYPFSFTTKKYSKMFLCDDEDDIYLIETSGCSNGSTYLVKKNDKGWKVSFFEGYSI